MGRGRVGYNPCCTVRKQARRPQPAVGFGLAKREGGGSRPRTSGASAKPSPWTTTWLSATWASVALLLLDLPVTAFLRRFMLRKASKRQRYHARHPPAGTPVACCR